MKTGEIMKIKDKMFVKNTSGLTLAVFGHCIFISLTSMALPMFFTDVLFLDAATVSTILLVTRIWDAINDPLMGSFVDRSKTKWGKCRPFLLYGAIPLTVFTILMFAPVNLEGAGKIAFAFTTYLIFITAFTAIDIPLSGLKPLLYADPEKRNKGQAISATFGSLGSLLAVDLFFIMVSLFGNGDDSIGYFITVVILALLAFVTLIAGFFLTKEVVPINSNKVPFKKVIKSIMQNKFLLLAIGISVLTIANSAYGILLPYFSKWNLADMFSFGSLSVEAVLIPVLSTATGIIYMIAIMATPWLLKLTNKKNMFIIMSIVGCIMNIVSYFVGYSNMYVFIALRIFAHFPPSVAATIVVYMVMDCLDYGEFQSNERTEGMTYAVNNFFMKAGNAVFSSLLMFMIGVFGYNAQATSPALDIGESISHNYPEMLNGIFVLMTIVPAIGLALQMIPMFFYKLTDKRVKEISDILIARRGVIEDENNITAENITFDVDGLTDDATFDNNASNIDVDNSSIDNSNSCFDMESSLASDSNCNQNDVNDFELPKENTTDTEEKL